MNQNMKANVKYSDRTQVNKTLEWPTFIEVAGTPNAGKNTIVIPILEVFLRDILGFKVVKLDEAVTYCPIGREFSVDRLWHSINQTCNLSLEAFREQGNNFVIQNRGLFDRLAFVHAFRLAEQIDAATERVFRDSILLCQKHIRVELVLLLTIQRDVSLQREAKEITTSVIGDLKNRFGNASRVPAQSMVAPESLDRLNAAYEYAKEEYSKQFNVVTVPDPTDSKAFAEWLVATKIERKSKR